MQGIYRPKGAARARVFTQHGYVLVFVGKEHHLANSTGYAYEHRVVAELALGHDKVPHGLVEAAAPRGERRHVDELHSYAPTRVVAASKARPRTAQR